MQRQKALGQSSGPMPSNARMKGGVKTKYLKMLKVGFNILYKWFTERQNWGQIK